MKRFFILLAILFCGTAYAQTETLNWYMDGNTYATTTCESGDDVLLPAAPTKRGYTFKGWVSYIPIEYLESTGEQYIDTGWYLPANKDNFKISVTFDSIVKNTGWVSICGVNNSNGDATKQYYMLQFDSGGNYIVVHNNDDSSSLSFALAAGKKQAEITYNNNITIAEYNELSQTFNKSINNRDVTTLWLFKVHLNSGDKAGSKIRMYAFSIKVDDVLVRDFIPVLDKNGTPCMYDKVEDKLYYNQGTGQFIAGPVLTE